MTKIEVEDTLRLITYIKDEQAKGFTKDEIHEKLIKAGWHPKDIEKYLTEYVLSGKVEKESSATIKLFAKYGKFLLPGEEIKAHYVVGHYNIVFTAGRLIILKKFPKNILEFNFKDIELVEYYTDIRWLHSLYFAGYFAGTIIFALFHSSLWTYVVDIIPIAKRFFDFNPFFGMNVLAFLIFLYLLYMALYDLYHFVTSFIGRLRIMPRSMGPTDIMCKLTPDVEKTIQKLEEAISNPAVDEKTTP